MCCLVGIGTMRLRRVMIAVIVVVTTVQQLGPVNVVRMVVTDLMQS